jgi:hypothetical protein
LIGPAFGGDDDIGIKLKKNVPETKIEEKGYSGGAWQATQIVGAWRPQPVLSRCTTSHRSTRTAGKRVRAGVGGGRSWYVRWSRSRATRVRKLQSFIDFIVSSFFSW